MGNECRTAVDSGDKDTPQVYGAIIFSSGITDNQEFKYKIRIGVEDRGEYNEEIEARTGDLFDRTIIPFGANFDTCYSSKSYAQDCVEARYLTFEILQSMVDSAYIRLTTDDNTILPASTEELCKADMIFGDQAMPFPTSQIPTFDFDIFQIIQLFLTPICTIISFAFTVPLVLKRIVEEKQQGVKELMKMMGLPSWLHWAGWFFITIITSTMTITVMVLVILLTGIFSEVDPMVYFFTLFFYSISVISFNFAQSTIFSNPNLAVALGIVLHFGTWIPAVLITPENYFTWSAGTKMAISLVPNMGFTMGFTLIWFRETDGSGGMDWSSLAKPINAADNLTLLDIWICNWISTAIFIVFLWYVDNVRPGKYGVAQKFYFPFQKSYWCGEPQDFDVGGKSDMTDKKMFEKEPSKEKGIEVNKLRKVFRGRKEVVAVNDVSFNAFSGEITALLGHNGAGKTTTMSMLTGLFSPTSGDARINGYNIRGDMEKARDSLGLCPQHNMLFPSLNVFEHLIFFGMLKGISMQEARKDANFYITSLNLQAKKFVMSTALSGGMKRKLHLAMALTGPSKILILDEPTSGMDPQARRGMWDVLQTLKQDRTIMLTTHFMEEADVLGDRIAIMADGKVKCCGSPMFLKSNLGSGFSLTVTKESNTSSDEILQLVQKHVKNAIIKNENSLEIIFELDIKSSDLIPPLASALDTSREKLGYTSFGFSKTTIEDVFLRVGEDRDKHVAHDHTKADKLYNEYEVSEVEKVSGSEILINHFKGLFTKRMISTMRMWKTYIGLSLFSFALIAAVGALVNNPPSANVNPPPDLSLSVFSGYDKDNVFLIDDSTNNDAAFTKSLEKYLTSIGENYETVESINDGVLDKALDNLVAFAREDLVGMTLNETDLYDDMCADQPQIPSKLMAGMYNTIPYHTRPLTRNIMSNAILGMKGKQNKIVTSSHPLFHKRQDDIGINDGNGISNPTPLQYMVILGMAMSLLLGIFIIFPLKERITNAKQVQMMAGVNPFVFWFSNFAWDFIVYFAISLVLAIILYLFDKRFTFHSNGGFGTLVFLFFLLGFAGIPWVYILSYPFKSAPAAYSMLIISTIVTGVVGPLAVFFLRLFYDPDSKTNLAMISDIVRYILCWMGPFFNFGRAIIGFITVQEENTICGTGIKLEDLTTICKLFKEDLSLIVNPGNYKTSMCCDTAWNVPEEYAICGKTFDNIVVNNCVEDASFWTFDYLKGINIDVILLCINAATFWVILIFIETNLIKKGWIRLNEMRHGSRVSAPAVVDEDVQKEKDSIYLNNNMMKVVNLTKKFGRFDAVRGLTFGVRDKECFGLLGVNEAGKTTTFRMITGDEVMTSGESFIGNVSLSNDKSTYLQSIGYCPQFDSIIEVLTGREMLTLFARIRGMRSKNNVITSELEKLASFVDLTEYLDRPCGQYSGGNKRKLNVALALIGRPKVMLLDEPTTGVDPAARRKIWETINNIRKSGTSIILTSHSMDECEALCDRLAIMVKGNFQCLGGPQHIKTKFGQGFQIILKLVSKMEARQEEILNAIKASVTQKFDQCIVTDEHMDYVHFHVANPTTPWH